MAATEADICNIALSRVGSGQRIADLAEDTSEAAACATHYEAARDAVLGDVPWKFATRRADLAVVTGGARTGWEYVYALPADCITPRYIHTGDRNPTNDARIPFDLEDDAGTDSTVLLTDEEGAELVYVARNENIVRYPPLFVSALAWRLAMELVFVLPVKPGVASEMAKEYRAELSRAHAAQMRGAQQDVPPDAEHIRGRE